VVPQQNAQQLKKAPISGGAVGHWIELSDRKDFHRANRFMGKAG